MGNSRASKKKTKVMASRLHSIAIYWRFDAVSSQTAFNKRVLAKTWNSTPFTPKIN